MCSYTDPMDPTDIDALLEAERRAREDIKTAETARAEAADRRALVIDQLASAVGPTDAARRIGASLSAVQKSRDRAKLVRALHAAKGVTEETADA